MRKTAGGLIWSFDVGCLIFPLQPPLLQLPLPSSMVAHNDLLCHHCPLLFIIEEEDIERKKRWKPRVYLHGVFSSTPSSFSNTGSAGGSVMDKAD